MAAHGRSISSRAFASFSAPLFPLVMAVIYACL